MSVIGQAPASVIWRSFKYVLAVCNSSLLLTTLVPLSHLQHTWFWSVSSMPRCFMAKKLKYPYQQWKSQTRPETDAENDIAPTPGSYHQLASISRSEPGLFFKDKSFTDKQLYRQITNLKFESFVLACKVKTSFNMFMHDMSIKNSPPPETRGVLIA